MPTPSFISRIEAKRQQAMSAARQRYSALMGKLFASGDLSDRDGQELLKTATELGRDIQGDASDYDRAKALHDTASRIAELEKSIPAVMAELAAYRKESIRIKDERKYGERRLQAQSQQLQNDLYDARAAARELETLRLNRPEIPQFEHTAQPAFLVDRNARARLTNEYQQRRREFLHNYARRQNPPIDRMSPEVRDRVETMDRAYMREMQDIDAMEQAMQATGKPVVSICTEQSAVLSDQAPRLLKKYTFERHSMQDARDFARLVDAVNKAAQPGRTVAL